MFTHKNRKIHDWFKNQNLKLTSFVKHCVTVIGKIKGENLYIECIYLNNKMISLCDLCRTWRWLNYRKKYITHITKWPWLIIVTHPRVNLGVEYELPMFLHMKNMDLDTNFALFLRLNLSKWLWFKIMTHPRILIKLWVK